MLKIAGPVLALALISGPAFAQNAKIDAALPSGDVTVTHWYKQTVYDPHDSKIGEVEDVLVNKSGQISTLMIGVGGFLGVGEKDVAVPFEAVKTTEKDNKPYLVMNTTKDDLKNAKGFKYDKNKMTWGLDTK